LIGVPGLPAKPELAGSRPNITPFSFRGESPGGTQKRSLQNSERDHRRRRKSPRSLPIFNLGTESGHARIETCRVAKAPLSPVESGLLSARTVVKVGRECIATALSVGLQEVVANFVCGIILLIEQSIRVEIAFPQRDLHIKTSGVIGDAD
jgi:hypothetical protein